MSVTVSSYQNQGKRPYQEDRFFHDHMVIERTRIDLLAVADGMGGHSAGDVAAEIAIQEIRRFFSQLNTKNLESIKKGLSQAYFRINHQIDEYSSENSDTQGMGTTLTCAVIVDTKMVVAHIGDSRAYIVNEDGIHQCTKDHTAQQEALDSGINIERINIGANALTRCLDGSEFERPDISNVFDVSNSLVFVCSDGVHGSLTSAQLEELSITSSDAELFTKRAVRSALDYGATDNLTIVAVALPNRRVYQNYNSTKPSKRKKGTLKRVFTSLVMVLLVLSGFSLTVFGGLYLFSNASESGDLAVNTFELDSNFGEASEGAVSLENQVNDVENEIIDHRGLADELAETESTNEVVEPVILTAPTQESANSGTNDISPSQDEEQELPSESSQIENPEEPDSSEIQETTHSLNQPVGESDVPETEKETSTTEPPADDAEGSIEETSSDTTTDQINESTFSDSGVETSELQNGDEPESSSVDAEVSVIPGYYLILSTNNDRVAAETEKERWAQSDMIDFDKLVLSKEVKYRVLLGPFEKEDDALQKKDRLVEMIPDMKDVEVMKL